MSELIQIDERVNKAIDIVKEMEESFLAIQMPRTSYVIEKFVVGQHDTIEMQFSQCVLEIQIKVANLKRAKLGKRKIEIQIKELEDKGTEIDQIDADLKRIDLQEQDFAVQNFTTVSV
jgi:hypothetical protein